MAVRFILGRSGTGKTSYCISSVVNALQQPNDQPLILLVPEQATYQAERAILCGPRIAGFHRLHVLSFERLSFMLMGRGTARPSITALGRQMIVHRILRGCRQRLRIFAAGADSVGLAQRMGQTISELHRYAKTPDDLNELLDRLTAQPRDSLTAAKFADIAVVMAEYLAFAGERFVDPDIQLNQACQAMRDADFARGARVWVDGFSNFPGGELDLLTELLKVAAQTDIALCLDPDSIDPATPIQSNVDETDIFGPTVQTYIELMGRAVSCRLKIAEPLMLPTVWRFAAAPALEHVERHIFAPGPPQTADADGVRVIAAANPRAEARFAAREIRELVDRSGLRYRDVAVIVSDMDRYEHYIRACFDDFALPFFIDRRTPLSRHGGSVMVLSALQAAMGGFAHGDVFACLKTDLFGIDREGVDLLENYCLAYGVGGSDWAGQNPWRMADPADGYDEASVDSLRRQVAEPLIALRGALRPRGDEPITVEQFTAAVFGFLDAVGFTRTLNRWIETAQQHGDYEAVEQHRQFYDRFVSIFDEMAEVFADCPLRAADFAAILNTGLSQLTLTLIPPTQDQVLVGSVERSRHPDLRAVFLLGATAKQFPIPVPAAGLLSDRDRDTAARANFEIGGGTRQSLMERRYLGYIAFTRPSQRLYVCYPLADEKGSQVVRSPFIDELEGLFTGFEAETPAACRSVATVACESDLAQMLCTELGRDSLVERSGDAEPLRGLLQGLCQDERLASLGADVRRAIDYDNAASLEASTVARMYQGPIRTSVSRLSTFAACPYQYFAKFTLDLRRRKEFKLEPLDLGSYYHDVLDALFKELRKADLDIAEMGRDALMQRLDRAMERTIGESPFLSSFLARGGHNVFLIDTAAGHLRSCVADIAEIARAGRFRPAMTEVAFGRGKGAIETLGDFMLDLPDGRQLCMDGKIDRIDIGRVGGRKIALVFDYKRGPKRLRWEECYYGLDMQLPVYILAATGASGSDIEQVAGAFYLPVEVNPKSGDLSKLGEGPAGSGRKARGILDGSLAELLDAGAAGYSRYYDFYVGKDGQPYGNYGRTGALMPLDFNSVVGHTTRRLQEIALAIVSGRIAVSPYRLRHSSPCSWCVYRPVCRFDWQINAYHRLAGLDKLNVIALTGGGDG